MHEFHVWYNLLEMINFGGMVLQFYHFTASYMHFIIADYKFHILCGTKHVDHVQRFC